MAAWQADNERPRPLPVLQRSVFLLSVISFSHAYFSFTSEPLLTDVSFVCAGGERLCVVGPNGAGKTTLLRLAACELEPDSGKVEAPASSASSTSGGFDVGLRGFAHPGSDAERRSPDAALHVGAGDSERSGTVGDSLDSALRRPLGLRERFERLTARMSETPEGLTSAVADEYDRLAAEMEAFDVWTLESRIGATLAGLGLGGVSRDRPLDSLSPGQRARLALAQTLMVRPPALVLDEPTNHLDSEARAFLSATMRSWAGPVLFTSHDRAFIDDVATGTLDLDVAVWQALARADGGELHGGIHRSGGGYSDYLVEKRRARAAHVEVYESQRAEKRRIEAHARASTSIGHKGAKPRTEVRMAQKFYADRAQKVSSRRINDDARRLEDLGRVEVAKPRTSALSFAIPPAGPSSGILVSVREAAVPGRLASVSFELSAGERLLLTGANGSGKSTLLRWIAAGSPPTPDSTGSVDAAKGRAYVPQDLPEQPAPEAKASPAAPGAAPNDALGLVPADVWTRGIRELGKGIVQPRCTATPFPLLSAGNRRRVQLALAVARNPRILLIDEPTNFLDLDFIEALENAMAAWDGTLVVATHDEWLIKRWPGKRMHLQPLRRNGYQDPLTIASRRSNG